MKLEIKELTSDKFDEQSKGVVILPHNYLSEEKEEYHSTTLSFYKYSKEKVEIAKILKNEGFITDYTVDGDVKKTITVTLKYGPNNEKVINGLKRISKPGLRVYAKKEELPRVLGGLGIAVISTSKGVMSDKQARKEGLGGEVIAYVW